jgi:hypothetical protein
MSYAVANMKKFKLTQVNGLGHHDERKTDHHRNQEIDVTKSSENYTVVPEKYRKPDNVSLQKFIQQRISEGRDSSRAVRKDAVALTEWVVGSDHQFFESLTNAQTKSFLKMLMLGLLTDMALKTFHMPQFTWTRQRLICIWA